MQIQQKTIKAHGIKFFVEDGGKKIARAYLYILFNEHDRPFGLMEDVFVGEAYRSQGLGSKTDSLSLTLGFSNGLISFKPNLR